VAADKKRIPDVGLDDTCEAIGYAGENGGFAGLADPDTGAFGLEIIDLMGKEEGLREKPWAAGEYCC
jgi:hypothetical protein